MSDNNKGGTGKFILGAICGAAFGAVAALLLAPKSGKELREDLAEGVSDLVDIAMDLKDSAIDYGNEVLTKSRGYSEPSPEEVQDLEDFLESKREDWVQIQEQDEEIDNEDEVVLDITDENVSIEKAEDNTEEA